VVSTTRRGLLAAAGAGALAAAGCGAPEEPPPDAELLGRVLALELALAEIHDGALAARARAAARRLGAAGAREAGGGVEIAGADPLALERRVMAACVEAVGALRDDGRRILAAELLTAAAQHESVLLARAGRDPLPTAFPGGGVA
jgi:acyl CoA:acetate/3-ketoacid CoA transferase alpha subunit